MIEPERINLEQAARGCISGTLAEWPTVARGLKTAGVEVYPFFPALAVRELAKLVLASEETQNKLNAALDKIALLDFEVSRLEEQLRLAGGAE